MDRQEKLNEIHNDGQTDAANGEIHMPHGNLSQLISFIVPGDEFARKAEENKAYLDGVANHRNQTK